jgi:hypothetical protein
MANPNTEHSERELQLLCIQSRALVEINEKLADIVTLAQQQADLLKRLLARPAAPTWNGVHWS